MTTITSCSLRCNAMGNVDVFLFGCNASQAARVCSWSSTLESNLSFNLTVRPTWWKLQTPQKTGLDHTDGLQTKQRPREDNPFSSLSDGQAVETQLHLKRICREPHTKLPRTKLHTRGTRSNEPVKKQHLHHRQRLARTVLAWRRFLQQLVHASDVVPFRTE